MTTQSTVLPAQTRSKVAGTTQTFFEIIAAAGLAILLLWKGIYRGWISINSDFSQYYVVARLIRERFNLSRIYDWIWLQRVADYFGVEHQLVGSRPRSHRPARCSGQARPRVRYRGASHPQAA